MSVVFDARTYPLYSSYIIEANGTVLQGAGKGQTILKANSPNFSLIAATSLSNLIIKDMTLDGQITTPRNIRGSGTSFIKCCNVTLENVEMLNMDQAGCFASNTDGIQLINVNTKKTWSGLVFNGCSRSSAKGCNVDTTDGDGIYLTDSAERACNNVEINGNTVRKVGDTGIDSSVKNTSYYNNQLKILNNVVDSPNIHSHSATPNSVGITVSRTANSQFEYNTVKNMRRPDRPTFPAKGIWIGEIPAVSPIETYVAHNTLINNDVPIKTAGLLPSNYVYNNAIDARTI